MKDIFKTGTARSLKQEDLYAPLKRDESEALADELEKNWNQELQISLKEKRKPKLINAIKSSFFKSYSFWGFIVFIDFAIIR